MRATPILLVLAAGLGGSVARGQAVASHEPASTHVFPAGGRRGTTVNVRVGGECFPPGMKLTLRGEGVTAPPVLGDRVRPRYEPSASRPPRDADGVGAGMTYPKEWQSAVTIAKDAPLGAAYWRVHGGWGGTRPRPFLVGDLPEFIETEPNSRPDQAERVELPVVINGQVAGERDLDVFEFAAKAGEVVVCDVWAARIGSPLDPVVEITDRAGRRMDADEVRVGSDPVLAFRVPSSGAYRVAVSNVSFHGGCQYVYRMTVSTRPFVAHAFPCGGRAGESRDVQLYALTGTGTPRVIRERVVFPATPGLFRLRDAVVLEASDHPEAVEPDDNHTASSAMELKAPVSVTGRFSAADEVDWFSFRAKGGEAFTIRCRPAGVASPGLPVLTLLDPAGRQLAQTHAGDAIDLKAPADGTYRLTVRDLQHGTRGGPESIYRLTVQPAQPDFALHLGGDQLNVVQGGKAALELTVQRRGGFQGAIDLAAAGLPAGVSLEPARVAEGQTKLLLSVVAKDDVRPEDVTALLRGKAVVGGKAVERAASLQGVAPVDHESRTGSPLHLTIQHKPVFRLTCNEAYQYAHRGTVYPYAMQVERLGGFTGPVHIELCDRQVQDLDGIEVIDTVVPAGVTQFNNLVYLPEGMHASAQHHSRPYAQGYATFTDRWGQKQTLLAVSEKRCMIRALPTLVRLRAAAGEVVARPGEAVALRFTLDRTARFPGPVELEMLESPGFSAGKVRIEKGGTAAELKVSVARETPRPVRRELRFRATGKLSSGETVVTFATVLINPE